MNATSQTAEIDTGSKKPTQEAKPATIDRNVLALGWVAFFGGLAQDMIQPLLPAFYRSVLGLSTEFIGLIEGSLTTVVSLMKIGAGYLSDALGVMALPASLIAGVLWHRVSSAAPFLFGAAMAGIGFAGLWLIPRIESESPAPGGAC